MLLFLMCVSVAGVIVTDVTPISTSVGPQLQMDIHFVNFKLLLVKKSFPTKLTAVPLVLISRVNISDVILHT